MTSCQRIWPYFPKFFKQLVARKSYNDLQTEFLINNPLKICVTPTQMIGLGIGGIIGTGIYVLSGQAAAEYAGPSIIISFIIAGIVALLSALSMAEMSSLMSSAGSVYSYAYVVLGEYPAFIIGSLSALLYQIGASAVVVSWSRYVVHFIDLISDYNITTSLVRAPIDWSEKLNMFYPTGQVINLPAIAITIAVTIVLIIGIRETVIVNLVFVVIKVIILLIFIIAGSMHVDTKNYHNFFPLNQGSFGQYGVTGMLHASTFVFFAYVGFESVTAVAQEAKKPSQSMPLALILSLVISLLIYVGVSTVMVGLVPYQVLNTTYPLMAAVEATPYGSWLPILLTLGAIASLTTVAITVLLAQSRIYYAMAVDGLLPSIFTRILRHTQTPWVSIIISGSICAVLAGICPIDVLGELASIAALIIYLFVHVCVIVMHYTHDVLPPFKLRFGPWLVPILGIILCILLLINTSKGTGTRFGLWMAASHIVYFSYGFWHSNKHSSNWKDPGIEMDEVVLPEKCEIPSPPKTNLESEPKDDEYPVLRL